MERKFRFFFNSIECFCFIKNEQWILYKRKHIWNGSNIFFYNKTILIVWQRGKMGIQSEFFLLGIYKGSSHLHKTWMCGWERKMKILCTKFIANNFKLISVILTIADGNPSKFKIWLAKPKIQMNRSAPTIRFNDAIFSVSNQLSCKL